MERNLTSGSVLKNIIYFSLPYMLSYFLQTLYGMADLFIIGQFDGVAGTTAVSNGGQVMYMLTVIIVGLAMGTTVNIGKAVGRRDREDISRIIGNTFTMFMTISVVLMVVLILLVRPIVSVIGSTKLVTDIPFTGVILPAAQAACGVTKNGKIGVIGTPATIKSGSFVKAIRGINPHIKVYGNPCPLFVHLVENGYTDRDNKITRLAAEEYLAPIKAEGVDTLILGCTHYPVIKDIIGDIMGENVTLISSGAEAAKYAHNCLLEKDLLSDRTQPGKNTFYASDSVELFEENAKHFLEHPVQGEVFSCSLGD